MHKLLLQHDHHLTAKLYRHRNFSNSMSPAMASNAMGSVHPFGTPWVCPPFGLGDSPPLDWRSDMQSATVPPQIPCPRLFPRRLHRRRANPVAAVLNLSHWHRPPGHGTERVCHSKLPQLRLGIITAQPSRFASGPPVSADISVEANSDGQDPYG